MVKPELNVLFFGNGTYTNVGPGLRLGVGDSTYWCLGEIGGVDPCNRV